MQQGNITKTIITDISQFNDIAEEEICWAFKIVSESYHGKFTKTGRLKKGTKDKGEPFPLIGKTIKYNKDLKQGFSEETKEYQDIKKIPFQTIQENHIELQEKGLSIKVSLKSLFDEKTLNNLVGKNIIFFAYDSSIGINKSTDSKQNAYCIYQDNEKRGQSKKVYKDRITSVELKIVESRFALDFDGKTLSLLENERILKEWEARSGMPIEPINANQESKRNRFKIQDSNTNKFYYYDDETNKEPNDRIHTEDSTKPTQEGVYPIKITYNPNALNLQGIQCDFKKELCHLFQHLQLKKDSTHLQQEKDSIIPLRIQYQKRILIVIERFKQTSESTMSKVYICLDDKVINAEIGGNVIYQKVKKQDTKEYETKKIDSRKIEKITQMETSYIFADALDIKPFAYILERPGPDSIGGELKLRIPSGRYGVNWGLSSTFNINTFNLSNDFVHKDRKVLVHYGNSPKDSAGCMLLSHSFVKKGKQDLELLQSKSKDVADSLVELLETKIPEYLKVKARGKDFIDAFVEIHVFNQFEES